MITFTVGKTPCKAFGKGAETVARWMQIDPNSAGEFEGYFDQRSEKFGREFVAVHGKPIEITKAENVDSPDMTPSGACAPATIEASAPSAQIEPIPAKEPLVLETDLAAKDPLPH